MSTVIVLLYNKFILHTQALNIIMRDDDARTVRLWKETLCNNGENEEWFGNFKLQ